MNSADMDRKFASTLERGLRVLGIFRVGDDALGNQEIAARTGIPKPTISRLTYTLAKLGYLDHNKDLEKYSLGAAAIALGGVASANLPFVDAADAAMQALSEDFGVLVLMAQRTGNRMLLSRTWRPKRVASVYLETGHRLPLETTASGKAYLCALDDDKLALLNTACDSKKLISIASESRKELHKLGFICSLGEWSDNVHAVATPFRGRVLSEPIVFACGATPEILPQERAVQEIGPALCAAVRDLERTVGVAVGFR